MSGVLERPAEPRLVLGFDAGCMTCSGLAKRIEEEVGERLQVRSLGDPQVRHWREEALGEDAPWAPTLIEVKSGKVRAWTGIRMGMRLSRALGPKNTWRVMQAIGEMNSNENEERNQQTWVLSRSKFLKGLGGAAVAMTVLSSTEKLSSSASAVESEDSEFEAITGNELEDMVRTATGQRDVLNCLDESTANNLGSGRLIRQCRNNICYTVAGSGSGTCEVSTDDGGIIVSGDCAVVNAGRHRLGDGSTTSAVAFGMSNSRVLVYYESDNPQANIRSEAKMLRIEGDSVRVENLSINGGVPVRVGSEPNQDYQPQAVAPCPPGECTEPTCDDFSFDCLAARCIPCAAACATAVTGAGGVVCIACAAASCLNATDVLGPCCNRASFYCTRC